MERTRFDRWTRTVSPVLSRRGLATALGLVATGIPGLSTAKKKKLKRNSFGCVDVGKACRGKDANCCSGICDGKKPKKGQKDKSRCVAHDEGGCQADQDVCVEGEGSDCPNNPEASCWRTTGKGSFCGFGGSSDCADCARDVDCEADFGAGAACVVCPDCLDLGGVTGCVPREI
jgi:hypothetical protein